MTILEIKPRTQTLLPICKSEITFISFHVVLNSFHYVLFISVEVSKDGHLQF